MKKQFYLSFPKTLVDQPVLFQAGHKFKIVTNIRGASVSNGVGLVALEVTGEKTEIEDALKWLEGKGIKVEETKKPKADV